MKRMVLAAALALAMAAPAAAEDGLAEGARAVPVSYEDLDLTREDDAAALLSRLRYAATRACAVEEIRRPGAADGRAVTACREEALTRAVVELDAPALTRLYAELRR